MKLRLLKLEVRPVFVLDDGTTLDERPSAPFVLTEPDIPVFPALWAERFAVLKAQVETPEPEPEPDGEVSDVD